MPQELNVLVKRKSHKLSLITSELVYHGRDYGGEGMLGRFGVEECLAGLQPRVSKEMNYSLIREFIEMEVKEALDSMAPLKSPGPDDFAASFFQNSWDTVGEEVCRAALGFLNYKSFDAVINKAYIALIRRRRNRLVSLNIDPLVFVMSFTR